MPFVQVGTGQAGCWCLAWAEDQVGFGARYRGAGYLTAIQALGSWAWAVTSNPQPGDLVFFQSAASNSGEGHVGLLDDAGSTFRSLWCDGRVMDGPIAEFATQNGAPLAGYVSLAALNGSATTAPTATSSGATSAPSSGAAIGGGSSTFGDIGRLIALSGGALLGLFAAGQILDLVEAL